jgi:hypothetical protein
VYIFFKDWFSFEAVNIILETISEKDLCSTTLCNKDSVAKLHNFYWTSAPALATAPAVNLLLIYRKLGHIFVNKQKFYLVQYDITGK